MVNISDLIERTCVGGTSDWCFDTLISYCSNSCSLLLPYGGIQCSGASVLFFSPISSVCFWFSGIWLSSFSAVGLIFQCPKWFFIYFSLTSCNEFTLWKTLKCCHTVPCEAVPMFEYWFLPNNTPNDITYRYCCLYWSLSNIIVFQCPKWFFIYFSSTSYNDFTLWKTLKCCHTVPCEAVPRFEYWFLPWQ